MRGYLFVDGECVRGIEARNRIDFLRGRDFGTGRGRSDRSSRVGRYVVKGFSHVRFSVWMEEKG